MASQCSLLNWLLAGLPRQALLVPQCLWCFPVLVRWRLGSAAALALTQWARLYLLGWHHLQRASRCLATCFEASCLRPTWQTSEHVHPGMFADRC